MNDKTGKGPCPDRQASTDLAREQFVWLRQIAYDTGLPPTAARVAIALTKYFNREHGGWSWMGHAALARDLGLTDRAVRNSLSALVELGYLVVKRRGMTATNLYHLALPDGDRDRKEPSDHDRNESSDHPGVTGSNLPSDRNETAKVTGTKLPTNPFNEPSEEPKKGKDSLRLDLGEEDSGTRQQTRNEIDTAFEVFFKRYPRRVGKDSARRAYHGAVKRGATPDQLLAGVERYVQERNGQDQKFTAHATTWLNAGRWQDEPAAPPTNGLVIDQHGNRVDYGPPPTPNRPPPTNAHAARVQAQIERLKARAAGGAS